MATFHQLAPAHARTIHDFMIIRTRIKVKRSFAAARKILFWHRRGTTRQPLSLPDKPNAAVNYSIPR
jgi:hypothetical protein